jgi:hypothetical protein
MRSGKRSETLYQLSVRCSYVQLGMLLLHPMLCPAQATVRTLMQQQQWVAAVCR